MSDSEQRGRDEDLSKTLGRFYERYLDKPVPNSDALRALTSSEQHLNVHFGEVFEPILKRLNQLGYPGVADPKLTIRSELGGESLLRSGAQVHYLVPGAPVDPTDGSDLTLPDRYNGLGFKNLIYMVVQILAAHRARLEAAQARPPVHLILIEEPEAHLHVQLQQVFIKQLATIVADSPVELSTQFVLTTHSPHIVYDDFTSIRYFARVGAKDTFHYSEVRDLSTFHGNSQPETRDFLLQYLKLTHCDLFFADAAILVEGNVERLLLPLLISRFCDRLETSHLTILELGGAFAHKFRGLVDFLRIRCLIITDLDSVTGPHAEACRTDHPEAITSNPTLKTWIPAKETVADLLSVPVEDKTLVSQRSTVRVTYQGSTELAWNKASKTIAGRTFEEAFIFENLAWSQDQANSGYKLRVQGADNLLLGDLIDKIFTKVRNLDKTEFALRLIDLGGNWVCPPYILEGLDWLADELDELRDAAAEPQITEAEDEPQAANA
ncbi:ATP-dependent nuclease [Kribbella sindirgiensis]|uniref:ATP-dependent nuclease n=1 Tax=Kribbella sindirgiensis TaxID=1124744 RepID=UPI00307B4B94